MTTVEFYSKFKENGFYYSKEQLYNLYTCLITKPFVILSGISGSGKSKIIELFGQIVTNNSSDNIELVAVKPNWRDSRYVFGYHNIVDGTFSATPILKLILRAKENPNQPFFLILDEMNLAKVEQYFADFLSLMETRKLTPTSIAAGITDLKAIYSYPQTFSLSEAIIFSALDIGRPETLLDIKDYRENRFSELWKEQIYGGSGENWTPQYRSELNQGDVRLAHRVFEGGNGKYKMKPLTSLGSVDRAKVESLTKEFNKIKFGHFKITQGSIYLHSSGTLKTNTSSPDYVPGGALYNKAGENRHYYVPEKMEIPMNVFLVGTVNIDETTHLFSPKVLDRSNVIEMNEIDLSQILSDLTFANKNVLDDNAYFFTEPEFPDLKISVPNSAHLLEFKTQCATEFKDLYEINSILKKTNKHFGYRVYNEISNYVLNAKKFSTNGGVIKIAVDLQILQKVLPKLHGSVDQIFDILFRILVKISVNSSQFDSLIKDRNPDIDDFDKYLQIIKKPNILEIDSTEFQPLFTYPRSAKKIIRMIDNLIINGYTTFIE